MNEIVKEWVNKAEGDFRTATRELTAIDYPNFDAVCFHSEQCIEKLMKTLLIKLDVDFEYTHNLIKLYEYISKTIPRVSFDMNDLKY